MAEKALRDEAINTGEMENVTVKKKPVWSKQENLNKRKMRKEKHLKRGEVGYL